MALYVYGLMRARDGGAAIAAPEASEQKLRAVEHDGVCALVSSVPDGPIRLRRESLLAHRDVLQAAFAHGPLLPLRFGTVVEDEQTVVHQLIASQHGALAARLDALEGKVEMQHKVSYLEEPLLLSVLGGDPGLARAATRLRELPEAASHFERIRVGEAIAGAVQARGSADGQALLDALSSYAVGVSVSPPRQERMLLNAAFLLERSRLEEFDAAVEELSAGRAAQMSFKLIGPLPPHSFADGSWQAVGDSSQREAAAWA